MECYVGSQELGIGATWEEESLDAPYVAAWREEASSHRRDRRSRGRVELAWRARRNTWRCYAQLCASACSRYDRLVRFARSTRSAQLQSTFSSDYTVFAHPEFDANDYANALLAGEPYPPQVPAAGRLQG